MIDQRDFNFYFFNKKTTHINNNKKSDLSFINLIFLIYYKFNFI